MKKHLFCLLLLLFAAVPIASQERPASLIAVLTEVDQVTQKSRLLLLNPETKEETVREIEGIVYNGRFFWMESYETLWMSHAASVEDDYRLSSYTVEENSLTIHVEGNDVYPQSISPDQSLLLYNPGKLEGENRALDLFTYELETGTRTPLTESPLLADDGFWSPDGRTIAFTAFDSSTVDDDYEIPPGDIYLFDTVSSHVLNLTRDEAVWDRFESWSPDGSQFAYTSEDKDRTFHVFIADRNGQNRKQISTGGKGSNNAKWAFEGTHLVYLQADPSGETEKMILVDLQTEEAKTLVEKADIHEFDLSPDRTQIAYISRMLKDSNATLCVFDLVSEDEWCTVTLPFEWSDVAWGN